jgi:hypothetical protein
MNGRDFLIWQRNFGATALTATNIAVPEPTSLMMLLVSAAGTVFHRTRISRRS